MVLDLSAILGSAIRQDAQQADFVLGKEWDDAVVQQVGHRDRGFLGIEFTDRHAGIGVDEGLLVNPPHALHRANVIGVLASEVAGMVALDLAIGLLLLLGLLKRSHLVFGQEDALLGGAGLKRLQPLLHGLQIVARSDRADPRRGHHPSRDILCENALPVSGCLSAGAPN